MNKDAMATDLPLTDPDVHAAIPAGDDRGLLIDSAALLTGVKLYQPGEEFANHYHEGYDEFFAVIEGEITVWTGRNTKTVLPQGGTLLCPRGEQHYLRNETTGVTRLLYTKVPNVPDDSIAVDWTPGGENA
ncbi:cupin domain-containing protein [Rhodococcus opacus]|uniref:cupin domain-containing protein n=1 Tax=Rhodococcus opacus TaxID=37919 RepID=UPI001C46954D|nr:cupin domain-containing protein [Rhodococcus opacus]MBV6760224.1 cupin domain-containing protein [Rhodococcus opacus]